MARCLAASGDGHLASRSPAEGLWWAATWLFDSRPSHGGGCIITVALTIVEQTHENKKSLMACVT